MEVFPQLQGLTFGTTVRPIFNNSIQRAVNGRSTRVQLQQYPTYEFTLSYDYLPNRIRGRQDLEEIQGFFLERGGNFEQFLYLAPDTPMEDMIQLGVGDGSNTVFQLLKSVGPTYTEPAGGVPDETDIQLYVDGILQAYSAFSLVDYRDVTFGSAPANGAVIEAVYQPLYRVTFKESQADFEQFMDKLWELQEITLESQP